MTHIEAHGDEDYEKRNSWSYSYYSPVNTARVQPRAPRPASNQVEDVPPVPLGSGDYFAATIDEETQRRLEDDREAHIRRYAMDRRTELSNVLKKYYRCAKKTGKRSEDYEEQKRLRTNAIMKMEGFLLAVGLWHYKLDQHPEAHKVLSRVIATISETLAVLCCDANEEGSGEVVDDEEQELVFLNIRALVESLKQVNYKTIHIPPRLEYPGIPPMEVWQFIQAFASGASPLDESLVTLFPTGNVSEVKVSTYSHFRGDRERIQDLSNDRHRNGRRKFSNVLATRINNLRNGLKRMWHGVRDTSRPTHELRRAALRQGGIDEMLATFLQIKGEFDDAVDPALVPVHRRTPSQLRAVDAAQPLLLRARELMASLSHYEKTGAWDNRDELSSDSDEDSDTSILLALTKLIQCLKSLPKEPQIVFPASLKSVGKMSEESEVVPRRGASGGQLTFVKRQIEVLQHRISTTVQN